MGVYLVTSLVIYREFWTAIAALENFISGLAHFSNGDRRFVLRREMPDEWSIVEVESGRPWGAIVLCPDGDKTILQAGSRQFADETHAAVSWYMGELRKHLDGLELLRPQKPMQPATENAISAGDERQNEPGLPPITDSIDKAIYEIVSNDPDLKDDQVAAILANRDIMNKDGTPLRRQSINTRRRTLEKMGYRVR